MNQQVKMHQTMLLQHLRARAEEKVQRLQLRFLQQKIGDGDCLNSQELHLLVPSRANPKWQR